ncbi:hypothetical protein LTR86_009103 [Recurvomyces mirabilis]|nr:hypothetical protein LTR86_009103 [Recurvomyces mirabilis]
MPADTTEQEFASTSLLPPTSSSTGKDSAKINEESLASSWTSTVKMTGNEWKPSREIWLVILGQSCCVFVVALDATILAASLPTVSHALNADAVKSYWFITAYLLASAVIQPLSAALADVLGRRPTFFSAIVLFTVGTIICCTAHHPPQMLVGRTIQGIGGGGALSVNLIILSDIIPLRQRSKYVGLIQLINSLATTFGPLVGAALIKTSWRWLFYINFPFCGIGIAAIPFLLRYVKAETTFYDRLSMIDWTGCTIFIIGATSFLVGLSWGGNQYSWGSAATLVPLVLGALIMCLCIAYEGYVAKTPFLRLSVFGSRSAIASYVCTILSSLTLFSEMYFLVLFLETAKLYSPLKSAIIFLSFAASVVPVSGITGALITKLGGYRWALVTGWIINTFGLGALMILGPESFMPGLVFLFILAGIGQGMLFMAHQVATQASSPVKDVAYASAMFSFCRSFGFCLGVALGGTAFQNFLRHHLAHNGLSAESAAAIASNAEGYATLLRSMAPGPARLVIVDGYTYGFRYLFATMAGISALGLVLCMFIEDHDLDVQHDSSHKLRSRDPNGSGRQSPEDAAEKRVSMV